MLSDYLGTEFHRSGSLHKLRLTIGRPKSVVGDLNGDSVSSPTSVPSRAGEIIPEVEGIKPWGPSRKRSPSVSKGPKPPIQLLQFLKNSPREVKRAHFRYILGPPPPRPTQEMKSMGPGGEGPSRSTPVSPAMVPSRVDILCKLRPQPRLSPSSKRSDAR